MPLWIAIAVLATAAGARADDVVFPGTAWETRSPAELGLDEDELDLFRAAVGGNGPGVVVAGGYLVYTWGNQTSHGGWASASKAVISTLLFFAIEEGKLTGVDELVGDHGWSLEPADQTMTFRQLANMSSGYTLPEAPGERWAYNDYAVKLWKLAVLESVFGISADDASQTADLLTDAARLGPLQFEDGSLFRIKNGVPRVNMTPRDFARVGWFWLQRGRWGDQQLLPQFYFDAYMRAEIPDEMARTVGGSPDDYLGIGSDGGGNNQTALGPGRFGFMWWFNPERQMWPDAPEDTFQANGHWNGEVMTMLPSRGVVAAWRGGTSASAGSFDEPMNEVLKHLVAAAPPLPEPEPDPVPVPALRWAGAAMLGALLATSAWLRIARRRRARSAAAA